MKNETQARDAYEADVRTVEMLCDRLADLGLAVGAETARELIRAIVAAERPRVEARVREQLETALRTIRVATQSALGVVATIAPEEQPPLPERKPAPPRPTPSRRTPPTGQSRPPEGEERRPVFRRPRR